MVIAVAGTMIPSYLEYQDYYTAIMKDKEYNKYLDTLPLEFVGISAVLNEDVEYFEGELPDKSDFLVKATFTEKGKEFEKILSADDFDLLVPADFYANGGSVTVSYSFTPDKASDSDSDPLPVTRSIDIKIGIKKNQQLLFNEEAEANADCGTEKQVNAVLLTDGGYTDLGSITVLEGFAKGDSIIFDLTSEGVAFGEAKLRIANTTSSPLLLSDYLELKVGGRVYPLPTETLAAKSASEDYVFVDLLIPRFLISGGDTQVEISFKKDAPGIAIDSFSADALSRGQSSNMLGIAQTFGLTVGEYLTICIDNGASVKFTGVPGTGSNGKVNTSTSDAVYAMGGASDGEYYYFSMTNSSNLKAVIYKVDPSSYKIVAKTQQFTVANSSSGDNARLFIKDGVLYCIDYTGGILSIALEDFNGNSCTVTKNNSISFSSFGTAFSACWVESVGRYAVLTKDGKVHILDESMTKVADSFTVGYTGLSVASLTADDKYIYVNYSKNAEPAIPIEVYTWEGQKVGSFSVGSFQLFPASGSRLFNVQSIFIHNGQLHIGVCGWGSDSKYYHDWLISMG